MLRGINTVTSGMMADESWQQILANNLAQIDTPGYRSETAVIGSFPQVLLSRTGSQPTTLQTVSLGAGLVATVPNLTEGALQATHNPLDVAIVGQGFFAVQSPTGVLYTRAGNFSLDAQGRLVTPQGYYVLSTAGTPIQAGGGAQIGQDGTVSYQGKAAGRIAVFNPASGQIADAGGGFFQATGAVPPLATPQLAPGYIEGSNVSAPEVLGAMIQVLRHFEAGQQFLNQDATTLDRFIQVAS
ncbi:MAG: flagellar hook-basal body protein [Thermaerobacter sp.]|nr:flagellar hook-basal body protein [Thermaerobacter sp.]